MISFPETTNFLSNFSGIAPSTITNSAAYTVSVWVKTDQASCFRIHLNTTKNGSSYWGYASSYHSGGNEWERLSLTIPANSGNTSINVIRFQAVGTTVNADAYCRDYQVEQRSHATPFILGGSRSVSGSLIDLTRTTDIDLSNMSFNSNAHITFDGTDDSIAIPSITLGNGDWTVEFVANAHSSGYHMMSNSSGGPVANAMGVYGNKMYYRNYDGAWQAISSNTTVNYNEIYHLVYVNRYGGSNNSGSMDMYINGEKDSNSGTNSYTTNGGPVNAIGRSWAGYFDGEIYICKRYTTGLSDEEVKQNYNSLKSRFELP